MKVMYKEYQDATFSRQKAAPRHFGLLGEESGISRGLNASIYFTMFLVSGLSLRSSAWPGPVLRAEQGDTLRVHFKNNADRAYSIQPHGVHYDKRFQGSVYEDGE